MINWKPIAAAIGHATQTRFELADAVPLSGGCVNHAWRIQNRNGARYFVKLNDAHKLTISSTVLRTGFESEHAGLDAIAATRTVRVPQPIAHGTAGEHAFLVLEYLDLHSNGNARLLGEQLAALHRFTSGRSNVNPQAAEEVNSGHSRPGCSATPCHDRTAEQFGWKQDNTLGETLQRNAWSSDWITFWREHRLGYQLDLAARNGYGGKLQEQGQQLMENMPEMFGDYRPAPSLLHGDLWGGNHAFASDGTPVLFDPAPYYGDREADLAMTELFGGFDQDFYAAYRAAWPLDAAYATRKVLYNLYHILNHANLFGGGYARQAEGMMQRLLEKP